MLLRIAACAALPVLALGAGCSLWRGDPATSPPDPSAAAPPVTAPPPAKVEPPARVEAPAKVETPVETPRPAEASPAPVPPTPESLAALLKVRGLDRQVPRGVYTGVRRPNDELHKSILAAIEACRRYVADYPGTEPWCEVKGILSRMELARVPRLLESFKAEGASAEEAESRYAEHLKDQGMLAESTAAECPAGSPGRTDALHALVYFCERTDDHEKLRRTAETLLQERPDMEGRPYVHLAVARSLIYTQRYEEAQKHLDDVIRVHSDDPEYVLYIESLQDALTAAGNLKGLQDLAELKLAEYPARIPLLPPDHYLVGQYEQNLCMAPFWIGFVRMALGDSDGAKQAFRDHIQQNTTRQEKAVAEGHTPRQDNCYITVEYRSKSLLEFLENYLGKVPRVDLDLGELWATPRQPTLRESRGKVVALLFRMPGNVRAESFLQHIDALARKHKDDLVAVTLGFRAGKPNPSEDRVLLQKMRDDLKRLNVDIPAGFDPDRQGQRIFREVFAVIGTPSFVVLNRKGELAWYLADPRELDRAVATSVIERLLAEPKG